MATSNAKNVPGKSYTFGGGLWNGVDDTTEPYDDVPSLLTNAANGYIADTINASGFYSRPGCTTTGQLSGSPGIGQGTYDVLGPDGVHYSFLFPGDGTIRRLSSDLSTSTNVTPTNIVIGQGNGIGVGSLFVSCNQLNGQLLVSDGLNKPWVGTNLSSTPITATQIESGSTGGVTLSRGSTDTHIASTAFSYQNSGTVIPVAAITTGTALPTGTIPSNTWGVYRVSYVAFSGVAVTAAAANFTTGYASEALAIAAVPAMVGGQWNMGYVTVLTGSGHMFIGNTDALAGGASGNPASTTNYYVGEFGPWSAFAGPEIYTDAAFFVCNTINGVSARTTIVWCEPNQPLVGYEQTNFADFWNLTQTGSTPIYGLKGTNSGLYYFRDLSIGSLSGAPSINFQNNATHDVISLNVGCVAAKTIQSLGNYIYFCDVQGRPWRFALGGTPEPIWQQLRGIYFSQVGAATYTASVFSYTWAIIEPNLNLYLCGVWYATGSGLPNRLQVFDAVSGQYCGYWTVEANGTTGPGVPRALHIGGIVYSSAVGQYYLLMLGTGVSGNGYPWKLAGLADNVWQDNGSTVPVIPQTQRLGYAAATEWTLNAARTITNSATPVVLTTIATNGSVSQGTVTPPASSDGTFLAQWMPTGTTGRGFQMQISPSTTTSQWALFRAECDMTAEDVQSTDS